MLCHKQSYHSEFQACGTSFKDRISAANNDPRRRWPVICTLLHLTEDCKIITAEDCTRLSNGFSRFFVDKIRRNKDDIQQLLHHTTYPLQSDTKRWSLFPKTYPYQPSTRFSGWLSWCQPSRGHHSNIINQELSWDVCWIDCPTCIAEGKFPYMCKQALVTPLLKKEGLDSDAFINYWPISNLHIISKIVEWLFIMSDSPCTTVARLQ